jgi:hypothetical protein
VVFYNVKTEQNRNKNVPKVYSRGQVDSKLYRFASELWLDLYDYASDEGKETAATQNSFEPNY